MPLVSPAPVLAITGGASGIGEAIVALWLKSGGRALVLDRDAAAIDRLRTSQVSAGPRLLRGLVADVQVTAEVDAAFASLAEVEGRLDLLINCAGYVSPAPAADISDDAWACMVDINLSGVLRASRAAYPLLKRTPGSAIVNISSVIAQRAAAGRVGYAAAKGGVEALTRTLAVEWGPAGIRCNAVAPGYTATPLNRSLIDAGQLDMSGVVRRIPLGRMAEPAEIAQAALFLGSPTASYINGQVLAVDGGASVMAASAG